MAGHVDMCEKLSILSMINQKLYQFAYVWIPKLFKIVIGLEAPEQLHILMHVQRHNEQKYGEKCSI